MKILKFEKRDGKVTAGKYGNIFDSNDSRFLKFNHIIEETKEHVLAIAFKNPNKKLDFLDRMSSQLGKTRDKISGSTKEAKIQATFERLGTGPSEYNRIEIVDRGTECCELCGTPIKHEFEIFHESGNKDKNLVVGSTCVKNQTALSHTENNSINIYIKLKAYESAFRKNKKMNIKSFDLNYRIYEFNHEKYEEMIEEQEILSFAKNKVQLFEPSRIYELVGLKRGEYETHYGTVVQYETSEGCIDFYKKDRRCPSPATLIFTTKDMSSIFENTMRVTRVEITSSVDVDEDEAA